MKFKKIYIEITNMCNKNCSFCSPLTRKKEEMTIDKFKYVLNEIKPYTNYVYLHVKGEPLLHSKFNDIIGICNHNNIQVNITTNGTLLLKQKDVLENKIIRQINISLHSFEKKFDIDYMNNIINITNHLLEKNPNLNIVFRFWALKDNKLSKTNKDLISFIEENYNINLIDILKTKSNIKIKERLYINKDTIFEWPSLSDHQICEGTCYGTRTHIAILVDGTVIPCCLDSNGIINLGNIFEQDLKSILNEKRFIELNETIKNGKYTENLCKSCTFKTRLYKKTSIK